jgi:hypothetical protein
MSWSQENFDFWWEPEHFTMSVNVTFPVYNRLSAKFYTMYIHKLKRDMLFFVHLYGILK